MGLAYRLRSVDLLAGVKDGPEFLAINPAGFIQAIQDGDVIMVESIATMEYLMAHYVPTPLAPDVHSPDFPALPTSSCTLVKPDWRPPPTSWAVPGVLRRAPSGTTGPPARHGTYSKVGWDWKAAAGPQPYLAGETFTAADISVVYALEQAQRIAGIALSETEEAYLSRTTERDAYKTDHGRLRGPEGMVREVLGEWSLVT